MYVISDIQNVVIPLLLPSAHSELGFQLIAVISDIQNFTTLLLQLMAHREIGFTVINCGQ
jgi:hypothetical protein